VAHTSESRAGLTGSRRVTKHRDPCRDTTFPASPRFGSRAWDDYTSWADDRKMLRRINRLIEESARDPAVGIGKPEPLSQNLSGHWSRRITDEHPLGHQNRRGAPALS